jgi:hypothetical protein
VKDTVVTMKDVAGGAEFAVKARKQGDVATVQKEAKDRAAKFPMKT